MMWDVCVVHGVYVCMCMCVCGAWCECVMSAFMSMCMHVMYDVGCVCVGCVCSTWCVCVYVVHGVSVSCLHS